MAISVTECRTVGQLGEYVDSLAGIDREIFDNTHKVSVNIGQIESDNPAFVSFRNQKVIKVHNVPERKVVKFNETRALRPQDPVDGSKVETEIEERRGKDDFCLEKFDTCTPSNTFGRIRGESCTTAANLFLGSKYHAVIAFREHNPLIPPTKEEVLDRFHVADGFFESAYKEDERAIYSSFIQNNLDRAGASMWFHGHAQVQQELGCHEGVIEGLLDTHQSYGRKLNRDYFQDLFRAHQSVGLGMEQKGVLVMPLLTPAKERHIRMIAYLFDEPQREVLFKVFRYFTDETGFGVKAFNFSIGYRPIAYDGRDWSGFPAIVADLVDRGDINKRNSDIGASELLLQSVIVATDPYRVQEGIEEALVT